MDEGSRDKLDKPDGGTHTDHSSPRPVSRELLASGEQLGRYRIVEPLGTGGMGAVYRAHDPDLNRDVAIKVLHSTEEGTPPAADNEKRLLREAQAMARLSHPNIVTVYDVGTFKGRVFIAMEWIDGTTLKQWLRTEKRDWRQRLDAVLDAGRGLAEAHRADVVHRDFKPDNVLVSHKGLVQVVDFGLARSAGEPDIQLDAMGSVALILPDGDALDLQLTRTGAVLGTPAYMSPEQFHGKLTTARSDQFGFAVVAFEALYGARPFIGVTAAEVMRSVSQGAWIQPAGREPNGAPKAVLAALVRGLAPMPEDRYPSMDTMLSAVTAAAAAAKPRSRLPWIAAALTFAALGTGTAAYLATRDDARPAKPIEDPAPALELEVPAHADDLRWPTPPIAPGPPGTPAPTPRLERPKILQKKIKILVEKSLEDGQASDLEIVLRHVDEDIRVEIRQEILKELQEALGAEGTAGPANPQELGERIKRRVFERIDRRTEERERQFKEQLDELQRELDEQTP